MGVCSTVSDCNNRNKFLTTKKLEQGYQILIYLVKQFLNYITDTQSGLLNTIFGLKPLLKQGILGPAFYGGIVYKFKIFAGKRLLLFPINSKK